MLRSCVHSKEEEHMDERSVEETCEATGSTAELQEIARKLASLAQEIRSIAATPLGETVVLDESGDGSETAVD